MSDIVENGVATPTATKKRGRPAGANGAGIAKKPGFTMKQLSTSTAETADKLAVQLDFRSYLIYSAGVLVFQTLSEDDQLRVIMEAKKLHAQAVKAEQNKAVPVAA